MFNYRKQHLFSAPQRMLKQGHTCSRSVFCRSCSAGLNMTNVVFNANISSFLLLYWHHHRHLPVCPEKAETIRGVWRRSTCWLQSAGICENRFALWHSAVVVLVFWLKSQKISDQFCASRNRPCFRIAIQSIPAVMQLIFITDFPSNSFLLLVF